MKGQAEDPDVFVRKGRVHHGNGADHADSGASAAASGQEKVITASPFVWRDPADIPARQWLYGRHLIRGYASGTIAPGGIGKSSLIIAEAIAMITGRNLLGVPVYGGKMRVWLWNLEDRSDELDRRIAATCAHFGIGPDDLGGRLFKDSGHDQALCTAIQTQVGTEILKPVSEALVRELTAKRIDVLIVDPFISSHKVPENDNPAIDQVVKEWGSVAGRADCAVELVHHTRKLNGGEATAEDARGGSAIVNALREARTLNRMGKAEAEGYAIENAKLYFRTYSDKCNLAPPPDASDWYRMANVNLANGDDVGVVERWYPPDAMEGITLDHLKEVQRKVAIGRWRKDIQAKQWVGKAVAEVLELDLNDQSVRRKVKSVLSTWTKNGMFREVEGQDDKRQTKLFVEVGEWHDGPASP